jgi:hypothetical protein
MDRPLEAKTVLARALHVVIPVLITLGPVLAEPAGAQNRSLRLERFHADIVVQPDGDVVVTETLRPRFDGSWNGIFRNLSLRHRTGDGWPERLDLEVVSVTDGDGQPLRVEREHPDGWTLRLRIWVPGARDATRTVTIRYRVTNAVRFFDSEGDPGGIHDELYWNVTGNQWEIPIDRASAEVTLPVGAPVTEAWAYTGPEGSEAQDAVVNVLGERVEAEARNGFAPGEGLTLSVSWAPGAVARPSASARAAGAVRLFWPLGIPLLALLGMGRLWYRFGRDPKGRSMPVRYEPPEDLSPAEVGTLIDHRAEMHDLTSTLVHLAVRGYLRIEERSEKRFLGLVKGEEYVFHLLVPRSELSGLEAHERRFLAALFSYGGFDANRIPDLAAGLARLFGRGQDDFLSMMEGGSVSRSEEGEGVGTEDRGTGSDLARSRRPALETVELSDLKDKFYRSLKGIRNAIYDRLVERGHYRRRPDQVKGIFVSVGIGLAVIGVLLTAATGGTPVFLAHPAALLGSFLAGGAVVLGFGLLMPARTVRGARTREAALGFKEFLMRVEEPRYRHLITSPDEFEKYLPFAMAFRVEDRWAKAFEGLYREPPDWYVGSNPTRGFRASDFTSRLSALSTQASSTFSSSPSGSGGGGSSGGGSGGGGGGGF